MGVFYILVSGAAFGLLPWFARVAYDHGAEPFGMLAARFVFASAVMVLIRYTKKRHEPRPEPGPPGLDSRKSPDTARAIATEAITCRRT